MISDISATFHLHYALLFQVLLTEFAVRLIMSCLLKMEFMEGCFFAHVLSYDVLQYVQPCCMTYH